MKTISINTRKEQFHEQGGAKLRIERLHFISMLILSLVFVPLSGNNFVLLTLNVSFFGEQNQIVETIWCIFGFLLIFPILRFMAYDSSGLIAFWSSVTTLMIASTPTIILLLKELVLIL